MDRQRCKPAVLQVADVFFSIVIIFPLIVTYWSTTWKFLDMHLFPGDDITSSVVCLTSGIIIVFACHIVLPLLRSVILNDALEINLTSHYICLMVYNYVGALGGIFLWRGVWLLSDHFTGKELTASVTMLVISLSLLSLFRCTGMSHSSPYIVIIDCSPGLYFRKARFRTQFRSYVVHVLDIFFTTAIILPCVVLLWAGAWNTAESIIPDENSQILYFIGMGVGFILYYLIFALQRPTCYVAAKLYTHSKWSELAFGNLFRIFVFASCITLWWATWGYIKKFVLSSEFVETHLLLLPLAHSLSIFLLLILQASSTLSPVGCSVDSELAHNGASVKLCLDYFNHFCGSNWPASLQINYKTDQEEYDDDDPLLDAAPIQN